MLCKEKEVLLWDYLFSHITKKNFESFGGNQSQKSSIFSFHNQDSSTGHNSRAEGMGKAPA
jgi:hypothetical protein